MTTKRTRLTQRDKLIMSTTHPLALTLDGAHYIPNITKDEVKRVKLRCRGHYWEERDFHQFIAISKSGRRRWFTYCHSPGSERELCNCSGEWEESKADARQWANLGQLD